MDNIDKAVEKTAELATPTLISVFDSAPIAPVIFVVGFAVVTYYIGKKLTSVLPSSNGNTPSKLYTFSYRGVSYEDQPEAVYEMFHKQGVLTELNLISVRREGN